MLFSKRSLALSLLLLAAFALGCASHPSYRSRWPRGVERVWLGPEYWTNRLQDWRLQNGEAQCVVSRPERNVQLLTYDLTPDAQPFEMSVHVGVSSRVESSLQNRVGFLVGVRGQFHDYRDSAIRGKGLAVGLTTSGILFIRSRTAADTSRASVLRAALRDKGVLLKLKGRPSPHGYRLEVSAQPAGQRSALATFGQDSLDASSLAGNVALLADLPEGGTPENHVSAWFRAWLLSGPKVAKHPERAFGPILFSQYTLSRGVLKLTAQLPPVGPQDDNTVRLQIQRKGDWETLAEAPVDSLARTATFRISDWDATKDVPYRLVYRLAVGSGQKQTFLWRGTIRKEPWQKKEFVLAAFTGNNDIGFPHSEIVEHVRKHNPDLLFFSGDQIYERVGDYELQRAPLDKAVLDYLRKWYLFGWAYRDLLKDRPSVSIPDDHDVYHGNIWGAGGRAAPRGLTGYAAQDAGGYIMPPAWVNMVQRTQTSHLPDPYDPAPVLQGIGVYYCQLDYAGLSFAILEDRKFKSAPKPLLPQARVVNGFAQNPNFDPKTQSDVPGAVLLGKRQLAFLRHWSQDWSHHTWMKIVLSQTAFACVQTLPKGAKGDNIVPRMPIPAPGEYPKGLVPAADMDSDGWPPSGRNRALREMRRAFALHVAGDQHLGFVVQYGIDNWRDAGYVFCVPSVSNLWPRRWFPEQPGRHRAPGSPRYTGDFEDGFGNKITVWAAANPHKTGRKPAVLYDRAPGYGIIRFDRDTREIRLECWPRWEDPETGKPYPDWPITIHQEDNGGAKHTVFLPEIRVHGLQDPVVQVIDEVTHEPVYTLRIRGNAYRPWVFEEGSYTVRVGDPDAGTWKTLTHVSPTEATAHLDVSF